MDRDYVLVTAKRAELYEANESAVKIGETAVVDEVLSGWLVRVLEEHRTTWKVMTHYGYIGYLRKKDGCLQTFATEQEQERFKEQRAQLYMVTKREADVLSLPRVQGRRQEMLYAGSLVRCCGDPPVQGYVRVETASGSLGYLPAIAVEPRRDSDQYLWNGGEKLLYFDKSSNQPERNSANDVDQQWPDEQWWSDRQQWSDEQQLRESIIAVAQQYLGTQYRWGGKTGEGIDCSGLAFMSYLLNGILIYRDAEILEGYPVHEIAMEKLAPADLLFFPGHVAIYLGDGRYIHSTGYEKSAGCVINSLNPNDPDYRDDLVEKLQKAGSIF